MTQPTVTYRIVSRTHINKWVEELQTTVPGWDLRVLWAATGTILPVFVPDANYTAETVDSLIRQAGAKDDAVHQLGR